MARSIGTYALAGFAGLWLAAAATAQVPDKFTNLQVFPKDISKGELTNRMREFSFGLGVRCNYCHVGEDNLEQADFASDEKPAKKTARAMIRMVDEINGRLLRGIETGRTTRVTVECQTCHHGISVPEPIEDIVARLVATEGVEAALTRHRELREEHYGRAAYDFSKTPLDKVADDLSRSGKTDEALALLRENFKHYPDDTWGLAILGGVHKARGEREEAIAAFKKILEINPESGWAKKGLEDLKAAEGSGK